MPKRPRPHAIPRPWGLGSLAGGIGLGAAGAFIPAAQAPLWLGAGLLLGAGAILTIQARKRPAPVADLDLRERALKVDREYAGLADGLDLAIFEVTEGGLIVFANPRAEGMFQSYGAVGRNLADVVQSPDLIQFVSEAPQEGVPLDDEFSLDYPRVRTVLARTWQETQEDSHRTYLILEDVTELRRLERIRRDFVANVSHELRTPLTTIRTMTETIADDPDDVEVRTRFLGRIVSEVDRLTAISDDLLTLAKAESQEPNLGRVDLSELCHHTVQQLQTKAAAKNLSIRLETVPLGSTLGNEAQLTQVIYNLVDNAVNYTAEGEVVVRVEEGPQDVSLSVTDTGMGIPAEHLDRIFERFYRVDKGRSRATGGTGLGLAIVRHIVESHQGSIRVSSEEGRGTTFTVTLPRLFPFQPLSD